MSKVVSLKAAKPAIERKRYAALVLDEFDMQQREAARPLIEKKQAVRRQARKSF